MMRLQIVFALLACALLPTEAFAADAATCCDVRVETLHLDAPGVDPDGLRVRVLLPPDYDAHAQPGYPVLYVNDGQDVEAALKLTHFGP